MKTAFKKKIDFLIGNESTNNKFPLLNKIIAIYIGVTLFFQISSLIAPVLTALAYTPFYSFKTYLGLIGAVLILADLITNKVLWRGTYCWLLYGIAATAVVSSLLTISYGITDNIFLLCWVIIEIALFYSLSYRLDKKDFNRFLFIFYTVISFIWFIACVISVAQFVIGAHYVYVVDPLSEDKTISQQGFAANRLYGIFNPINHAAYISLMLSLVGIYLNSHIKNKYIKTSNIIAIVFFISHLILCVSRSAMVAAFAIIAVTSYLVIRNKLTLPRHRKVLISLICAILIVVISFGCYTIIKKGASRIPRLYHSIKNFSLSNQGSLSDDPLILDEEEEDLLDRNLKEDSSNGRIRIWSDYLSLYKDIGMFGFSAGNYMAYIKEHHPSLYIVEYIKETLPTKYEANIIYHVHNGYIMVFVSAGFIGIILLFVYLILCAIKVLKYIYKNEKISKEFIILFSLVIAGCVAACFDRGIFLSDNGQTFVFWIAAGSLMKHISSKNQEADNKE